MLTCIQKPVGLALLHTPQLTSAVPADWLQIWAANTHLTNPHDFKLYQLVNIGAMYPARQADTLADLAHRFRSDIRSLMVLAIQIHPTCFSTAHQFDISILNIPQI